MDPFNGDAEMHLGLDIGGIYGSPVRAAADGVVIYAARKAAYGNLLILDHGNGLTTRPWTSFAIQRSSRTAHPEK